MSLTKQDLEAISELIKQSENRVMTYIESHVEKDITILAEGLSSTNQKLDRMNYEMSSRLDKLENQNIDIMRAVIKDHSIELAEHEKRIDSNTDDIKILKLK